MTFTEAQQAKIVDVVRTNASTKGTFADTIKPLKASLDAGTITQEQYNEQEEDLALKLYDTSLSQISEEEKSAVETAGSLVGQELKVAKNGTEQKESLEGGSYSYFDMLKESPGTYKKMASYVAKDETDPAEIERLMKEWCESIETIRGDFTVGALSPELQDYMKTEKGKEKRKIFETGLSIYFTDWFNHLSDGDKKQVAGISAEGMFSGAIAKASSIMGIFTKLTSFQGQIASINTIIDAMYVDSSKLLEVDPEDPTTGKPLIETHPAFQSPDAICLLLQKNTPPKGKLPAPSGTKTFEQIFSLNENASFDHKKVIDQLGENYDDNTHALMEKVRDIGPQIITKRAEFQTTFESVLEQLNQVAMMFGAKSVSAHLEGTRLGGVANFVCSLIGKGSLKQMEMQGKLKNYNTNCPEWQREGMEEALTYISSFADKEYYKDATNPLRKPFDTLTDKTYTDAKTTKNAVVEAIPDAHLLQDGIQAALNTDSENFFVHPRILLAAGITNTADYFDGDGETTLYKLKEDKVTDYKKMVSDHMDAICKVGRATLLEPGIIIDLVAGGKTQADIAKLLITGLSFPDYAVGIVEDDLSISGSSVGDVSALVGYGKTQQEALDVKMKKAESEKLQKTYDDAKKNLDLAIANLATAKQPPLDITKVATAQADVDRFQKDFDEAEKALQKVQKKEEKKEDKPFDDEKEVTKLPLAPILTAGLTGAVLNKTSEEINKLDVDERAIKVCDYLTKDKQLSLTVVAGIIGNMYMESRFKSRAIGDSGDSLGLCQWHKKRKYALIAFAGKEKKNVTDFYMQLDYLLQEKERKDVEVEMSNAESVSQATEIFCRKFEVPNMAVADLPGRQAYAKKIYNKQMESQRSIEKSTASIELPPQSLDKTTKCFGASNARRIAESLGFDNCNSFQGNTTDQLRAEAQKVTDRPDNTVIVSTVNNSYEKDVDVDKAVDYIRNMIGLCHSNGKRASIVIHPNPDTWFEMEKTPHRFDKFQDYNEKVRNLCLSYPDPKPCVLDFTKQTNLWDIDGYHFNTDRVKDIMEPYMAKEVVA